MIVSDPLPYRLAARLERPSALDAVIDRASPVIRRLPRPVRDALHGVPAGHPIHPVAVLVPMGAWMSAAVLDVLPGNRRAARRLVGVGVVTAAPAIAAGLVDWALLGRRQQRVGAVHALTNAAALGLYTASWLARRRGLRNSGGRGLAFAGLALISVAGYLGGHLTYRQGAGVTAAPDE